MCNSRFILCILISYLYYDVAFILQEISKIFTSHQLIGMLFSLSVLSNKLVKIVTKMSLMSNKKRRKKNLIKSVYMEGPRHTIINISVIMIATWMRYNLENFVTSSCLHLTLSLFYTRTLFCYKIFWDMLAMSLFYQRFDHRCSIRSNKNRFCFSVQGKHNYVCIFCGIFFCSVFSGRYE